jgi:hypothetical protein
LAGKEGGRVKIIARFNLEFGFRTIQERKIEIQVPAESEIVACRVEQAGPVDEVVALYVVMETTGEMIPRKFRLVIGSEALPESFKRYVATFKFRNGIEACHIVEV